MASFSNPGVSGVYQGSGDIRKNLAKLIREYPKQVASATKAELQIEKRESMKRTPWRTKKLMNSHQVIEPVIERGRIYSGVSAGNEETQSYDVIIHEDLELHHPHGQAKFLESTMRESARFMAARIAKRVELKVIVDGK
jgi:L-serine deaminase